MASPRDIIAALDPDTLRSAVEASRSWRQVLLRLGLRASRHVPDLRLLCQHWQIPHEHLGHQAPADDRLREVLADARSWPEALRRLGYSENSGSARAAVRRHALRLGLDVRPLAVRPAAAEGAVALLPEARHLRDAGVHLVAAAFVMSGCGVAWPLEPAAYDLVVDMKGQLLRVQVKTTTRREAGSWVCSITRSVYADVAGGKRRVCYEPGDVDLFAIVDGDEEVYVIPFEELAGFSRIALHRFAGFRIPRLRDRAVLSGEEGSG